MTQMRFLWRLLQLLWLSAAMLFCVACTRSPPAQNSAPAEHEITNRHQDQTGTRHRSRGCTDAILPEVRWLGANAALIVEPIGEQYWKAKIAEGSHAPMIEFLWISLPTDGQLIPTSNGDLFALYDVVEDQVRISSNLRDWSTPSSPPSLSQLFPEPLDRPKQERVQLYWIDNKTLVVRRSNFSSGSFACTEYHTGDKNWRQTDTCLDLGDTPGEPVTIQRVADNVFAVGTSAEGETGISLLRLEGSAETSIASLSLGNGVMAHVEHYRTPDATIISSQVLAGGIAHPSTDGCWQLYAWNLKDNSLGLVRSGLPRNARLRPGKENEWLWPTEQGELCLGDPDANASCVALPKVQQ